MRSKQNVAGSLALPVAAMAAGPSFAALRRLIREEGLLDRQPLYYAVRVPLTIAALIPAIAVIVLFDSLWVQIPNAAYMALVYTQIAFVGHDCGHRQIFRKPFWNDVLALSLTPLVGVSYSWWFDTHNRHHAKPNQIGSDPAVHYDTFVFSQRQAGEKGKLMRLLIRFQAFYFVPLAMLYSVHMRFTGLRFLLKQRPKYVAVEVPLLLSHFILYPLLVFSELSLITGLVFIAIHQCLFGLFLVSTFAPNHKGMELLDEDHGLDFLHQQVLTAQNLQSHRFADFWFGGLNHQIEHHLFPNMPRNRLKKARLIIKKYCQHHGIPYHEAKAPGCYWEIVKYMHEASAPLRGRGTRESRQPSPRGEP
ncbi:MAG TPA: acyl-CoA desaturase [Acidobacteriota bacterium]|nr:acyl-CoA desaturase [Acidobacteriota bacterium]